jgi:ABC-2 type transport system permease protein
MQTLLTLTRRELAAYFFSFTGYIILAAAVFLMGFSFDILVVGLRSVPTPKPITEVFYDTYCFWIILLLAAPVITMRLFAHEKSTGTFETLMTAPVGDAQVVVSKFAAAMFFYMVMWLPLLACLLILQRFSENAGVLDAGAVGATFIGILLLGGLFISLGCFTSSITRSQTVAAMVSLVGGFSLFLLSYLARLVPVSAGSWKSELVSKFAFSDQMNDFARGIVDTRAVVVYLCLTFFFLFLTLRAVESRRWK